MRILIAAATTAEIKPFASLLQPDFQGNEMGSFFRNRLEIHICITGVGMMQATYMLTEAMHRFDPDFALQAGVAGVFDQKLPLGTVAAVGTEILGDLGAEDRNRFIDSFELGLLTDDTPFVQQQLVNPLYGLPAEIALPVVPSLSVNCVSGNATTIRQRQQKYDCTLESMEGAAFHFVCLKKKKPFLQVRCVSNDIIPRDKSTWDIATAIINLNNWLIEYLHKIEEHFTGSQMDID